MVRVSVYGKENFKRKIVKMEKLFYIYSSAFILMAFLQLGCSSNPCFYPKALKASVEKELKKSCSEITVKEMAQVKKLKFETSKDISRIETEDIKNFAHLLSLDFSGNKNLTEIPNFVYSLPQLEHLDISSTGISNFDSKLCRMKNLESLIGKNNSYKNNEIPFHTFCLENLKTLDMSNSGIIYIDEYIYYLTHLNHLYLKENSLFTIPLSLNMMSSLKTLDLRENKFKNKSMNVLIDCTKEDSQDCQENLRSDISCEGFHRFPHNHRGIPFRRYRIMTDQEFLDLEVRGKHIMDMCYQSWVIDQGGFDPFAETSGFDEEGRYKGRNSLNAHLLSRTINGKTMREWRLALDLKKTALTTGEGLWSFFRQRGPGDGVWFFQTKTGSAGYLAQFWRGFVNWCNFTRTMDNWVNVTDENHTADESEAFPKENTYKDFEEKEEWNCN